MEKSTGIVWELCQTGKVETMLISVQLIFLHFLILCKFALKLITNFLVYETELIHQYHVVCDLVWSQNVCVFPLSFRPQLLN